MNLDPRSMIAMAGFMSAIMAIVLLFMRRYYPPSIRGVGAWAAAPLLCMEAGPFAPADLRAALEGLTSSGGSG